MTSSCPNALLGMLRGSLGLVGKLDKVLHRLGHSLAEQTNLYFSHVLPTDGNVKPNFMGHLGSLLGLKS